MRQVCSFDKWFKQCTERALKFSIRNYTSNESFLWLDVGAGGGELAKLLSEKFPFAKGVAVDFHSEPDLIKDCNNVEWIQADLNTISFKDLVNTRFDLVCSITVLEHILSPERFINECLSIINDAGTLYITAPDYGSIASKVFGRFWPYLIWGEHLNIPSRKGILLLLERLSNTNKLLHTKVFAGPIILPYPLVYYLKYFGFNCIAKVFPRQFCIYFPTGILEAIVSCSR